MRKYWDFLGKQLQVSGDSNWMSLGMESKIRSRVDRESGAGSWGWKS